MKPSELDALYAFAVATMVAALLTPLTMALARRIGAVDEPSERGLSASATPLLGGLAIFAAVLVGAFLWLAPPPRPRPLARRAARCGVDHDRRCD
jgi:UDP-GlcNAc:undecaprenyl-phosphate GlcNAc-1-phosphate transferase